MRFPWTDKTVIQDAAVVGKVFWPGAVAHVGARGRWAIEEALHGSNSANSSAAGTTRR